MNNDIYKYNKVKFNNLYNLTLSYNILKFDSICLTQLDNIIRILIESQSSLNSIGGNDMDIINEFSKKLTTLRKNINDNIKLYNGNDDNEELFRMFVYYLELKNKNYNKQNILNELSKFNELVNDDLYSNLKKIKEVVTSFIFCL